MSEQEGSTEEENTPKIETDLIKSFMEVQKQKALNDHMHLQIEEKRLGHDFNLANKQLEIQGDFIKKDPTERRKTLIVVSIIAVVVLLIILGSVSYTHLTLPTTPYV